MNVISAVSLLLFAVLFVTTLVSYGRRRDPLSRDVMLIFASVAALFVSVGAAAVIGRQLAAPLYVGALLLLFAQPLFALRLANSMRPVPRPVLLAAVVGFLATTGAFFVVPLASAAPLVVAAEVIFTAAHVAAAYYLAREAVRRVGSARVRLGSAAAGGVTMAVALMLATFGARNPILQQLGGVVALVSATLYVLAFMPPAWVRKVWSAVATYEFLQTLVGRDTRETADDVWARAAALARRMSGAAAAVVVSGEPARLHASSVEGGLTLPDDTLESVPSGAEPHRRVAADNGGLGRHAERLGAPYVSVVPFADADGQPGSLVVFRARPSLFTADDDQILRSLVASAALFAQRNQALDQQAALADRLTITVTALERASQAKSDFLASMSHELRTPLSSIIGFSALMLDEPLDGDRRGVPDEWIQHIHRSGQHLLALINDVLDLTKIEAGRIELQREAFDLGAALNESVEGLRPLADRKQIRMRVEIGPGVIMADRGRLRQIIYNLLSNAIKFTPDGGTIRVESCWDGDDAQVAVTDTGSGIAHDDLERIFEEFSQVGDVKAREAGTGLGLALSRRLAEAHGGTVTVTSELGVGSRFEVDFPASRATGAAFEKLESAPAAPSLGETTVLVIEDDPGAVRLIRTYLENEGYRVVVAPDGEAGIAAARSAAPMAIVLDVLLPGIDGWEVLRRLKADASLRDIPVVVVTVIDERNVAMNLGAVDYFLKPVRPEELLTRLRQYTFTTKVKQRRVKVLAIDDDPTARDLVVEALRPVGFDVSAAASGREGLAMAMDDPPELVICDLIMPDVDGFEVVDQLRAHPATREATILILTGHELSTVDRQRLNGKVADVLGKAGDIRPSLAKWLERAAAAAQRRVVTAEA